MRLLTYRLKDTTDAYQVGLLKDKYIYPVEALKAYVTDEALKSSITSDPELFYRQLPPLSVLKNALEDAPETAGIKETAIEYGPVVTRPSKIICVGVNYLDHVKEMGHDVPTLPVLFSKFPNALIGHNTDIMGMAKSDQLDYEVELACVIGKTCTEVSESEALDYILGYTIANDISARDLQKRTPQWLQGKTLDKSTPVGPVIVTTDELNDASKLAIKST